MTMGANIQWGYAGLVNFGIMGFTALGGLAAVLVSYSPVREAWSVGGVNMIISLLILIAVIIAIRIVLKFFNKGFKKYFIVFGILLFGFLFINQFYGPAVNAIEDVSNKELDWFFDPWLHDTQVLDYGIKDWKKNQKSDGTWLVNVDLVKYGIREMSQLLEVGFSDGSMERIWWENHQWR